MSSLLTIADPIGLVHSSPDCAFPICSKSLTGDFTNHGSVSTDEANLFEMLSSKDLPTDNLFLALNSYFCPRSIMRKSEGELFRNPYGRSESNLRSLNAVFVDVDCGRDSCHKHPNETISPFHAETLIRAKAEAGEIPSPSIYVRSGRGLWALWLLHSNSTARVYDQLKTYKMVNKALQEPLKELPVDPAVIDGSRLIRFPNSVNTESGEIVRWSIEGDNHGGVLRYHLADLAEMFKIPLETKPARESVGGIGFKQSKNKRGQAGFKALNEYRISDFRKLFKAGHIKEGTRRIAITEAAKHLRALRVAGDDFREEISKLGHQCRPPFPPDEIEEIVIAHLKIKPANLVPRNGGEADYPTRKNQRLVRELGITSEITNALKLKQLVPIEVKRERDESAKKKTKIKVRREEVLRLRSSDPTITRHQLAQALGVSIPTIERDLSAIRKQTPSKTVAW